MEQSLFRQLVVQGRAKEVEALLQANPPELDVNLKDEVSNRAALHDASNYGHFGSRASSLGTPHAIDVNVQTVTKETPFLLCYGGGHVAVARLLLRDARVNITMAEKYERTPLWLATFNHRAEVIKWVMASGKGPWGP